MKSTKRMLLGIVIALIGVGLAQPGNNGLVFRSFIFIDPVVFTVYLPLLSMAFIFVGVIVGIAGYMQKNQE